MSRFRETTIEYHDAFEIVAPDGAAVPLWAIDDVARSDLSLPIPTDAVSGADSAQLVPDPSEDYGIELTAEGGIEITFKTLDERLWLKVRAAIVWLAVSLVDIGVLHAHTPPVDARLSVALGVMAAALNLLIVLKPVEIYRSIEIRPDCMIIDGEDIFLMSQMQEWPSFQPGHLGVYLRGVYGTREVEFLTLPQFDEFDRTPQVFAAHLAYAIEQLWSRATGDPTTAGAPRQPTRSRAS